jgi:hypothetical protein
VEISYVMNVDDYRAWNRYVMKRPKRGTYSQLKGCLCGGFLVFLVAYTLAALWPIFRGSGWSEVPIPIVIMNTFFILGLLAWDRVLLWFIVKEQSPADRAKLSNVHRIKIIPEALLYSSHNSSEIVGWTDIQEIAITEDHIFIFHLSSSGHGIPRRAFESIEQFREFGKTAQKYKETTDQKAQTNPPKPTDIGSPAWMQEVCEMFRPAPKEDNIRPDNQGLQADT